MQSFSFNLEYAKSLPSAVPLLPYTQYTPKGVLDLLRARDIWDFGSAAWFLNTQCSEEVRLGLRTKGLVGWQSYITNCVGTEPTEDRQEYWIRAAHAFSVNLD